MTRRVVAFRKRCYTHLRFFIRTEDGPGFAESLDGAFGKPCLYVHYTERNAPEDAVNIHLRTDSYGCAPCRRTELMPALSLVSLSCTLLFALS